MVGVVSDPYAGFKHGNVPGLAVGTAKGILGLGLRPLGGFSEFCSKSSQGLALVCLGRQGIQGRTMRRVYAPGISRRLHGEQVYTPFTHMWGYMSSRAEVEYLCTEFCFTPFHQCSIPGENLQNSVLVLCKNLGGRCEYGKQSLLSMPQTLNGLNKCRKRKVWSWRASCGNGVCGSKPCPSCHQSSLWTRCSML